MTEAGRMGICLHNPVADGPQMVFRLSELVEPSVVWVIGFNTERHGRAVISQPQFNSFQQAA